MKITALFFGIFLVPLLSYAQTEQPDTLQLDIKTGQKIILIGKDLNSFKNIKADSIIRKALLSVKDSLKDNQALNLQKVFKKNKASIAVNSVVIGAALMTNKIVPSMGTSIDFEPGEKRNATVNGALSDRYTYYTFINVGYNAYYFFEKDNNGTYKTYSNIFAEGSIGRRFRGAWPRKEISYGVGYLIKSGGFLHENAFKFKVFASVIPTNSFIRLRPEIYITNNFRKAFPGISTIVKLF